MSLGADIRKFREEKERERASNNIIACFCREKDSSLLDGYCEAQLGSTVQLFHFEKVFIFPFNVPTLKSLLLFLLSYDIDLIRRRK